MTDPHAHMRFRRISTRGTLPDGRVVQSHNSYPLGTGKAIYDAIDAGMARAFGSDNVRTVGEPMVTRDGLEVACRAVAADHYSRCLRMPADDPRVAANVDDNWQEFARDAEIAIAAYLSHPARPGR